MAYNYPPLSNFMFGSGSDGDATISTTTYTGGPVSNGELIRDAFFNNLTITSSGQLKLGRFRLFVKGTLDISGASGVAILNGTGLAGINASGATQGGNRSQINTQGTVPLMVGTGAGAAGGTGAGATPTALGQPAGFWGGDSNVGGKGGNVGATLGGNGGAFTNATRTLWKVGFINDFLATYGTALSSYAGCAGSGGGAGAGSGGVTGGGGGGGAQPGGYVYIAANILNRSSSNVAGTINANGLVGGNGGNGSVGNTGGGGGGAGGGGGVVYLIYNSLAGTAATDLVACDGGNGGTGGNGSGTGEGGTGGTGGGSGQIFIVNLSNGTFVSQGPNVAGPAGSGPSGTTGGAGGTGSTLRVTL